MDLITYHALVVGVMAGYAVTVFNKPWTNFSETVISLIDPENKVSIFIVEALLVLIGMVILIIMVTVASAI